MTATATESSALRDAPKAVMKVREAAHHLDCDTGTIYYLIRTGQLRAIRLGRVFRIPVSALADFIAGRPAEAEAG